MITAEQRIAKMSATGSVPHALLFVGQHLDEIAYRFASEMILKDHPEAAAKLAAKTHPDIHLFHPEGRTGMHAYDALKRFATEVAYRTHEAPLKFLILHDAERCLPASSNALLKTVEEPVSHSVMILLTSHPEKILPTIASRCQTLVFNKRTYTPGVHQNRLLDLLQGWTRSDLEALADEIEAERKEWEKKMIKALPKDLPLLQREKMEREIEGSAALEFQEKAFALLETFLLWARDVSLHQLGLTHYYHADRAEQIAKSKPFHFESVEKKVVQMKTALERSTSLQSCLEVLFFLYA